jgi:hypothetical protein
MAVASPCTILFLGINFVLCLASSQQRRCRLAVSTGRVRAHWFSTAATRSPADLFHGSGGPPAHVWQAISTYCDWLSTELCASIPDNVRRSGVGCWSPAQSLYCTGILPQCGYYRYMPPVLRRIVQPYLLRVLPPVSIPGSWLETTSICGDLSEG